MMRPSRSKISIAIMRWETAGGFHPRRGASDRDAGAGRHACDLYRFAPVAMLKGVSKFLFTPLAMAVIFAMLTSYLPSRTLVATMAINLLPEDPNEHGIGGRVGEYLERFDQGFERFKERYKRGLRLR